MTESELMAAVEALMSTIEAQPDYDPQDASDVEVRVLEQLQDALDELAKG